MERFSWLVVGVIVLATGVMFLTDKTQRGSTVEAALLWVLVLSGIKMTIIGALGLYPLPRWLNFLVPNPLE
jgi:predicted tellurium resistance membrane protein TerC